MKLEYFLNPGSCSGRPFIQRRWHRHMVACLFQVRVLTFLLSKLKEPYPNR